MDEQTENIERRNEIAQQTKPLRGRRIGEKAHAGDIATRPIKAVDKADGDGIGAGMEDNRDCQGCRFCRQRRRHRAAGDDDVKWW